MISGLGPDDVPMDVVQGFGDDVPSEMWFDCVERKKRAKILASATAPRAFAAALSFQACCVRSYVHFVCVCVYICMCVYVRICIYVYICMCICICTSMRLYTCVCVCECIFVHRLWVLV